MILENIHKTILKHNQIVSEIDDYGSATAGAVAGALGTAGAGFYKHYKTTKDLKDKIRKLNAYNAGLRQASGATPQRVHIINRGSNK